MIYLSQFTFPSQEREEDFLFGIRSTCYTTGYPFGVLTKNALREIDCSHVTLLYGGNGSGQCSGQCKS